ncbi:hypothetical protein EST38_g8105 [Candolleomyces aberdarensis]|uniref:Uncharacterized protein n=1 Tax=Candolleomyces aberdarensis TaxID=2316362 RepID=A0A4Q2DGU2_9AGAR|nr:hypothetical protein EST38_g8105 [Candolleomyces aberdarensis]
MGPRLTNFPSTGSGESGKSTIIKQMKILHKNGFSKARIAEYRPVVYKNVLDSAQQVVLYMRKTGIKCVEYSNRALAEKILDYRLDMEASSGPYFSPEIAEAIHQLWKDPIIPKIMDEHSSDFYLMDSAG